MATAALSLGSEDEGILLGADEEIDSSLLCHGETLVKTEDKNEQVHHIVA